MNIVARTDENGRGLYAVLNYELNRGDIPVTRPGDNGTSTRSSSKINGKIH